MLRTNLTELYKRLGKIKTFKQGTKMIYFLRITIFSEMKRLTYENMTK